MSFKATHIAYHEPVELISSHNGTSVFKNSLGMTYHFHEDDVMIEPIKLEADYVEVIRNLQKDIHNDNIKAGWWTDLTTGTDLAEEARKGTRLGKALVAEKLCLIHSEVSEGMEGARKNLPDDKLPHRKMIEVELADAVIRILDLVGALNLDIAGAIEEKRAFNAVRPDHKIENRQAEGGKAY